MENQVQISERDLKLRDPLNLRRRIEALPQAPIFAIFRQLLIKALERRSRERQTENTARLQLIGRRTIFAFKCLSPSNKNNF